jgi:hypothetical protein
MTESNAANPTTTYWLVHFTKDTWQRFTLHGARVVGFKPRQRRARERVRPGDVLLPYLVGVSRYCGVLEVTGPAVDSDTPIFAERDDPYTLRLPVAARKILSPDEAISVHAAELWKQLSFTKDLPLGSKEWTQRAGIRQTLVRMRTDDGAVIVRTVLGQ